MQNWLHTSTIISSLPYEPVENIQAITNSFVFVNTDAAGVYKIILSFESNGALLEEVSSFDLLASIVSELQIKAVNQ